MSRCSDLECGSHAILLANVLFITATFPNPPALRAAPFTKGGFWVPSFIKGGTGRISPAVAPGGRTPNIFCRALPCLNVGRPGVVALEGMGGNAIQKIGRIFAGR